MPDAAEHLDRLEAAHQLTPRWAGSRFAWVKTLLPAHKGKLGEQLFDQLCEAGGVALVGENGPGHDRRTAGHKVEIKLSTLYATADPDDAGYKWLQLRPEDDYDLVVLIGIEPDRVHVWAVDKTAALVHSRGQHGGKDAAETRMIELGEHDRPAWLGADLADDPGRFAAAVA